MLTIGSIALQHHVPKLLDRRPRDIDVICTWEEFEKVFSPAVKIEPGTRPPNLIAKYPVSDNKWVVKFDMPSGVEIWECEIAWPGSTAAELLERAGDRKYATPEECLALKLSHRYLKNSPYFTKTMRDIQALREWGYELDEWLVEWVKRREDETYHYAHPRLDRNKDEFFSDDGVQYVFDHDTLHQAVAQNEQPAYTYFQVEGQEVLCDMNKFDTLPLELRLAAVWEESAVLALERSVVPFNGDPETAFMTALKKVCTSITSGRFREFAWEHYDLVVAMNETRDYVALFQKGLEGGIVKPMEETHV